MRPAALAPTLSGRAEERARLLDVVRAGLEGSPRAALVHGEAGIGKTTLVRNVCQQVQGEGAQVLWGQSLRFGAVEAMYHPLVLALEGWLSEADESERASVLEAVPGAALILPSLGAPPTDSPSILMTTVDALISRVVEREPTVLVVDDVQWADPATWDALSYLVAGFGHQRLVLVTTHRDEGAVGEHFQHWLGNIRRLPGTEELALTRLDQDATGDQIALLLGRPAAPRLVDQVYDRSRGNPYFSELLVRRGDLDPSALPDDLPDELSRALLDAWRELSAPAREITRILAVAGRPTDLQTLAAIAAGLDTPNAGAVREAIDAGVVVIGGEGVWFRHPLLADVLTQTYLPGEATPVHAAWAAHLETVSTEGIDELRRLGDLASHHERAGDSSAAFAALLQGADLAEKLTAPREAADLLTRAADLWEVGADPTDVEGHARLLERASLACSWVGRGREGRRLLHAARDLVSPERDPLWASMLTLRTATDLADIERAVDLSQVDPESREHADALSRYAQALAWAGRTVEARQIVEAAIVAAHRSGSPAAISRAHFVRVALVWDTDLEQAYLDSAACWEHAFASGEPVAMGDAYVGRLVVSAFNGDLRMLREHARDAYEWFVLQGSPGLYQGGILAAVLLAMGDLVEAEAVVRAGLAATGNATTETLIRLQAGVLAIRRGEGDTSRGHVTRAQELMPHIEERPENEPCLPFAQILLAQDGPAAAFEYIERVLPVNAVDKRVVDELMVLGARAAADLVQQASDERDQAAVQIHREALTRLVKTRATLPGVAFQPSGPADTVQPARAALFAAEVGRAEIVEDQARLWRDATTACATAGLGWEQQLATWRLASALVEAGGSGTEAAGLLRGVHDYATQQGAAPLKARIEELSASARISLTTPRVAASQAVPAAFTGLTARETEVLAHLVANRTNAEIAQALFISEKTVSVHVSNLLRKTDTGSRREVAALARRVGWGNGG